MGSQTAMVAYRITAKSHEVKVRLPLNFKNMRKGSMVCQPAWFLFMQLVKCVCMGLRYVHVHVSIMCSEIGVVRNNCGLVY